MTILNLVDKEKSGVTYTIYNFPDGQQSIEIHDINYFLSSDRRVIIYSRFNSFKDLELIICSVYALRDLGAKDIELYIPYVLGARSDRRFVPGTPRYLSQVIAPILNSLNLNEIHVLDPHSDVMENVINNLTKKDNTDFVKWVLSDLGSEDYILVSPDAGALKKVFTVAERIYYTKDIIIASKHRDIATGEITHTEVPIPDQTLISKDFIIIDDICDGGKTFIEIAKELKKQGVSGKIYLIVTHGIFSKGYKVLGEYFNGVFCTNSIQDIGEVYSDAMGNLHKTKIKQLNIF